MEGQTKDKLGTRDQANQPGELILVDQLVSPTPGLVAQMTGRLTTKRYRHATVFVDQYSGLGYIYPQKTATAEETVEAKKSFEDYCESQGVQVRAYHANNGVSAQINW